MKLPIQPPLPVMEAELVDTIPPEKMPIPVRNKR